MKPQAIYWIATSLSTGTAMAMILSGIWVFVHTKWTISAAVLVLVGVLVLRGIRKVHQVRRRKSERHKYLHRKGFDQEV